ncbi:IS66 family insertion sequence element accessory protein TnpB [Roseovarius sp. D22-M7]|uniref:IS66 family insertion sequence element accessory protein TnpB n=1 Tax=Roseovarius sp. D22-M7 TaxID=3127116 RepID=UPI00300FC0B6
MTTWRRQYRNGDLGGCPPPPFTSLALTADTQEAAPEAPTLSAAEDKVEIALGNGRRMAVPVHIDPTVLARLLPVVDGH